MGNTSKSTNLIIEKLGYSDSNNLYHLSNIDKCEDLSFHNKKVLKELNPIAFYCVDNKPFILFFEDVNDSDEMSRIYKKIWNSQIPVVIFNNESSIRIYNGGVLESNEELCLVKELNFEDCTDDSDFSYWNITKTGFWQDFSKKYSSKTLNEIMLNNIEFITNKLKEDYDMNFATKLVLRLIFIRFFIDRGVDIGCLGLSNDIMKSRCKLLEIVEKQETLYSLFAYLKETFNGNLFELDSAEQHFTFSNEVLQDLSGFLSGELILSSGQLSLFPQYDFNIIPVELISNIYEVMLGRKVQNGDKAFYTPNYLVDYILHETVDIYLRNNKDCTVLDPSCGSGIFLVGAFRRIADNHADNNGYIADNDKLIEILTRNIYGVDKNKDAVDVTIFSLYLTILDYKDPKSLKDFKLPNLRNMNLIVSDFFNEDNTQMLKNKHFDFILGNPPWGNIKEGLHLKYCSDNKIPQQNNEISKSFIMKIGEFCDSSTLCCLVLPSKMLYNGKKPSVAFRKLMLNKLEIMTLIELSSVRKLVFKNADAPAMILIFKHQSNCLENKIKHISLKPNVFFKLFNIIVKGKNDIKFVPQKLLDEYDWAWKTIVFGTAWDFETIKQLKKNFSTIKNEIRQRNTIITGTGIQENGGDKQSAKHLIGKRILPSRNNIDHFTINTSMMEIFNKPVIHRARSENRTIFKPPYCLVMKGPNTKSYKMKASYSEDEFLFREAVLSIKGEDKDKEFLLNLTGFLNSSFYAYLSLMLASSFGVEREQRFLSEIEQYPIIQDTRVVDMVALITKIKNSNEILVYNHMESEVEKLDNLILDLFELKDNPFVDYALNFQIPELTNPNNKLALDVASDKDLILYAKVFSDYWMSKLKKRNKTIKINIYTNIKNRFTVFELEIVDMEHSRIVTFHGGNTCTKEIFTRFMINKVNDMFYDIKDVINFEENSFFIIKTNERKNWHPAMAHIDLSEVIDSILSDGEVK